jgi:hypothetical protein
VRRDGGIVMRPNTHVERERHALGAELLEPRADELGRRDGEAADYDPVGDLERLLQALAVADAAAELHAQARARADARDEREVDRGAPFGAIEVDDMEPAGTEIPVSSTELDRVDGVARLARKIALNEPHAASVAKIDSGYELH